MNNNGEGKTLEEACSSGRQVSPQYQLPSLGVADQQELRWQGNEEEGLTSRLPSYCDHCLGNPQEVKTCHHCDITMCSLHLQLLGKKEILRADVRLEAEVPLHLPEGPCQEESQLGELSDRLQLTEKLSQRGREEVAAQVANARLREKAAQLLEQIAAQVSCYGTRVMEAIDAELRRSEEALGPGRPARQPLQPPEDDQDAFSRELRDLQPQTAVSGVDAGRLCGALEALNTDLRAGLADAQRALRATINPSEVTLDPNTAHPSLLLSEDLKTATFSVVRQPYPTCRQRFINFLQALSSQGFSGGRHRWRVQADGCQWAVAVCYRGVERAGLASALESSPGCWCLMWCNNLLRAYYQGREAPLKRCTALHGVEVRLSYEEGRVSFYSISAPQLHLHTFQTQFAEPLHLAIRMMSPQPKSHMTLCS